MRKPRKSAPPRGPKTRTCETDGAKVWTFSPVCTQGFATSGRRVLLLGAEPHGSPSDPENPDMGPWFRESTGLSDRLNYQPNTRFFRRSLLTLAAALAPEYGTSLEPETTPFSHQHWTALSRNVHHLRYADIKHEAGGSSSVRRFILDAARREVALDGKLAQYWSEPSTCPVVTVVMGSHALAAWEEIVWPYLQEWRRELGLWVAMPHPSDQVAYESISMAVQDLHSHLRPISGRTGYRYVHADRVWAPIQLGGGS
jgi:hypothetical protein